MRSRSGSSAAGLPARAAASAAGRPAASSTAASASRALPAAPAMRPQFGSRPWAAALTRLTDDRTGHRPGVGVVAWRPDLAGDEGRGAFAVGGLLAREVAGDRLDRRGRARLPPA